MFVAGNTDGLFGDSDADLVSDTDPFIAKVLTSNGTLQWVARFGSDRNDFAQGKEQVQR